MKNEKVSLLRNDDVLIVPIQGELNDKELEEFKNNLLERVMSDNKVRAVVLDVSNLCSMDLFTARLLMQVVEMLELMDLKTVMVGFSPEVALTLIDIEVSFAGIATAVNLEKGLLQLRRNGANDSKRK